MSKKQEIKTVHIAIPVVEQTAPAILYSLVEIFNFVGVAWENMTGEQAGSVRMQTHLVSSTLQPMECAMGALVRPQALFQDTQSYDIIIATDMLFEANFNPRGQWKEASGWIRQQYEHGALLASVCTGSLLLAESGLLDGLEATTHWSSTNMFNQCYPNVILKPERVLSLTGTAHRVVTAGGASSWAELSLYLIAQYCGREEAARSAKIFLLGDRSQGQLPFASMARPKGHEDAVIDRCQLWIAENYQQRNPVSELIKFSGLAERTFKRRFKNATGYSPIEYVQTLRIEEAKHLLETGSSALDEVAWEVGYEDPAAFRRLFKRMTGVTPAAYRQRYQRLTPK